MQSNFLELDNPSFDLSSLAVHKRKPIQSVSHLSTSLREVLVIQPPLAPNERLPRSLLIDAHVPSLSWPPILGYSFKAGIGFYLHPRHAPMYELAFDELHSSHYSTTHGTAKTQRLGCSGPLCRRIRNVQRYQSARLRDARATPNSHYSHFRTMKTRYQGLLRNQPIYGAVEPLLEAMTIWAHEIRPPDDANHLSSIYLKLSTTQEVRHDYLNKLYSDAVRIS